MNTPSVIDHDSGEIPEDGPYVDKGLTSSPSDKDIIFDGVDAGQAVTIDPNGAAKGVVGFEHIAYLSLDDAPREIQEERSLRLAREELAQYLNGEGGN